VDPNIIVLALNPSYDPINDEEDEKVIRESLIKNLKGHTFLNWFDYKSEKGKTDSSGFKFWKKSLGSLLEEGKNEEYILKNMGFFNFCGYHSNPFKSIPEKCFVEDYKLLATQSKLVEYLNLLIEHENPYVIVLWGYDYWKKAGLEVKQSKLVIVNKYKGRNHNITNIYTHKESLRNIVDDCINNNNNNNSDVSLRYQELYKSLKGIIQD